MFWSYKYLIVNLYILSQFPLDKKDMILIIIIIILCNFASLLEIQGLLLFAYSIFKLTDIKHVSKINLIIC